MCQEQENLWAAIRDRRSIRSFASREVPEELLERILEAGCWAPSAGNTQPWEFYVLTEPKLKSDLARAALGQEFVAQAPVVILVCALWEKSGDAYRDRGVRLYCLQDTAAAVQNMLLAAHACGLGSCWVGAFDEAAVSSLMELPRSSRPVAIIPLGYPAETPRPRRRLPLTEVVKYFP